MFVCLAHFFSSSVTAAIPVLHVRARRPVIMLISHIPVLLLSIMMRLIFFPASPSSSPVLLLQVLFLFRERKISGSISGISCVIFSGITSSIFLGSWVRTAVDRPPSKLRTSFRISNAATVINPFTSKSKKVNSPNLLKANVSARYSENWLYNHLLSE